MTGTASAYDAIVVGAGVVGTSIAYGLSRAGNRVCLLDEGDDAFRASRGNFGLIWVQGKGVGCPAYARWSMGAAAAWPQLAAELEDVTGLDVDRSQIGGLTFCIEEEELATRVRALESLRSDLAGDYPFEVLRPRELRALIPESGQRLAGAVLSPLDGHVSPLKLLRALFAAFQARSGRLAAGMKATRIEPRRGEFLVHAGDRTFATGKVVLAAGLANRELAPQVGLEAPVVPIRGQILVTERTTPFLKYPTLHVRQTGEGVVQIGDSKEDVGYDDGTTTRELARIGARAVRCFPCLAELNVVRAWGALRVMSPDGLPIYQASVEHPGAFIVTCHSGITLAPAHAGSIADWIRGGTEPAGIAGFKAERFGVQVH